MYSALMSESLCFSVLFWFAFLTLAFLASKMMLKKQKATILLKITYTFRHDVRILLKKKKMSAEG